MTLSPIGRPLLISMMFTEARPSATVTRSASPLFFTTRKMPTELSGLAEARARDVQHVRQPLDLDRAVDREVGARAGGSASSIETSTVTVPCTDDGSVRMHAALHDVVVVQVDRRRKTGHDVLRQVLRNAEHRLELAGLNDAGDDGAGVHVLAELERRIAERLELARPRAT